MKKFNDFVLEARKNYNSDVLMQSEITKYINKVNRVIPKQVQNIIYLTQKYNLTDSKDIDEIRNSSKSSMKKLAEKFNIGLENLHELYQLLKDNRSYIRLLPQYQSKREREAMELGKMSMDDLTIDLETPAGRNAATKMYMPLIYKIVNQYLGKSEMSRSDLIASALLGFTSAMNDWKRDAEDSVSFKTYAGYRAKQQILNDMNNLYHTVSGAGAHAVSKYGVSLRAASIDAMMAGDDEIAMDKLNILSTEDTKDWYFDGNEEKKWSELFKLLEDTFQQRDVNIFYRFFGLNGHKREKSKDIAKSMGMSEGNIRNTIINRVIKFLKNDKKASDILSGIQDIYNESLMMDLVGFNRTEILEALTNDDTFILLEELNRWSNKEVFRKSVYNALDRLNIEDSLIITDMLSNDFDYIDARYKKNRRLILFFLSNMYPTENFTRKSDVTILEYMIELQKLYQKYKI